MVSLGASIFAVGSLLLMAGCTQKVELARGLQGSREGAEYLFFSDWTRAAGASVDAVQDGGKWNQWQQWNSTSETCPDAPEKCSVKVVDEPDFPTGRAFVVGYHGYRSSTGIPWVGGGNLIMKDEWPSPEVGQTLFHRFYFKNNIRDSVGDLQIGGDHPFQGYDNNDGAVSGNCSVDWNLKFGSQSDGTYMWMFYTQGNSWQKPGLPKFTARMKEIAFTRVATNAYRVRMRLDGVEISGEIGLPTTALPIGDACLRTLYLGNNDPGGNWRQTNGEPNPTGPFADLDTRHWGAIAVTIQNDPAQWIGPYDPSRGW